MMSSLLLKTAPGPDLQNSTYTASRSIGGAKQRDTQGKRPGKREQGAEASVGGVGTPDSGGGHFRQ